MKKVLIFSMIVTILLVACKKDKEETSISLKGKWTIENFIVKDYENGVLTDTDTEPGDGTTYDFQDNGHLIITSTGSPVESLPYTIKTDSKVDIDGDIMDIQNLSSSKVTLYYRDDYGQGDYAEIFLNLKR